LKILFVQIRASGGFQCSPSFERSGNEGFTTSRLWRLQRWCV